MRSVRVFHLNSNYLYTTLHDLLINELKNHGVNNTIYMPYNGNGNFRTTSENEVLCDKIFSKGDRFFYLKKQKKIIAAINEKYSFKDYDVTHAHTLFTDGFAALYLKEKYGIPYVVTVRNTDLNYFFKYRINLRKIGLKILREADKVIFLSASYKEQLIDKYVKEKTFKHQLKIKSIILPNGIDKFWLENKYYIDKSPVDKELKLIYIGEISKNKNVITSINAIKRLRERGMDVSYTIIGSIKDKSIMQEIKKHKYINFLGRKDKKELMRILREHHIFIMPSKNESFGLVYAEAMSQSVPVIYSKNQGFDNQFENGTVGYSVVYNSEEDIVKAIQLIIKNYKKISKNCFINVDKFNWKTISLNIKNLYYDIKDNR